MPEGKVVITVKDSDGWFYVFRTLMSGDRTPFSSLKELEVVLGVGELSIVEEFLIDKHL